MKGRGPLSDRVLEMGTGGNESHFFLNSALFFLASISLAPWFLI